jgi:hypothetical protein
LRVAAAPHRDLGELALALPGLLQPRARLQRRERHRVGPERREHVRIELRREHFGEVAGDDLPNA